MRAGEALVKLLEAYGVDTVFGIPGTHSLELYRGLSDSGIRHISPRHEQGGGFMADGYARASGKPGVCFVITGPGVTNMATPLGEAYMDSVPMLVISPVNEPDPGRRNMGRLHEITDQAAVTAPLTGFSAVANRVEDIPLLIGRAFSLFASERPRPVHISIPLNVLTERATDFWSPIGLPSKPAPSEAQVDAAAAWLNASSHPVIVAGGGAIPAASRVLEIAERLGAPLLTTVAGRGIIPDDHPLCPGAQLRAPQVRALLANADLALLLGTELAQPEHYADQLLLPERQIRVNIDGNALLDGPQTVSILADVAMAVEGLLAAVQPGTSARLDWASGTCRSVREDLPSNLNGSMRRHLSVLHVLGEELPDDAQVVSDMTQLAYTAVEYLPWSRPNGWLHPTGYGTLGYALPAAIGAKLAVPDRRVVALAGDAGVQYTLQELTLAAELELDLVLVLWNNDTLHQIADDMDEAGIFPIGVSQRNPDFLVLARACGWAAVEVDSLADLRAELRAALSPSKTPTLIQLNEHALPIPA